MAMRKPQQARRPAAPKAPAAPVLPLRRLAPICITAVMLLGIFLLPYHFPLQTPSESLSWEFGFNNAVAQALIGLLLLLLFAWELAGSGVRPGSDPVARTLLPPEAPVSMRPLLYTMGVFQAITCIVILVWFSVLPVSHYGGMTYFIQRIEAVLLGRRPYLDFAFDYGPAMLGLPVNLYRICHGAISVEAAYAAALIIHFTAGLALLAYVVSQLNARAPLAIFAMVAFGWINWSMGLNDTPLRFTAGLASLFAIRRLERFTREDPALRRLGLLGLAGFALPLLSFLISPETGAALTCGLLLYFLWFSFGPDRRLALLAVAVLAAVAAAAVILPRSCFDIPSLLGTGRMNLPILPTIYILALLAMAIWILPQLGISAVRDDSANAPFSAGLAVLLGLMTLPATGRCDPSHIWMNSTGLVLLALAAASWLPKRWWHGLWAAYFLIFVIMIKATDWSDYQEQVATVLNLRGQLTSIPHQADNDAGLAPGDPRPVLHYGKLLPSAEFDSLPDVKIGLPLGDNEVLERFLKLRGRYVPEYHIEPSNDIHGPADLTRKFEELKTMPYVFIPAPYLTYLRPVNEQAQAQAQAAADSKYLSVTLLFPISLPAVHPLFRPAAEIMAEIAHEYEPAHAYRDGVLLKRKDLAGP
jgi:hypothetical protein